MIIAYFQKGGKLRTRGNVQHPSIRTAEIGCQNLCQIWYYIWSIDEKTKWNQQLKTRNSVISRWEDEGNFPQLKVTNFNEPHWNYWLLLIHSRLQWLNNTVHKNNSNVSLNVTNNIIGAMKHRRPHRQYTKLKYLQ